MTDLNTLIEMVEWIEPTEEDKERGIIRAKFFGEEYQISTLSFRQLAKEELEREMSGEPTDEDIQKYGRREAAKVFISMHQARTRNDGNKIDIRKVAEFLYYPAESNQAHEAQRFIQYLIKPWGLEHGFTVEDAARCIQLFLENR